MPDPALAMLTGFGNPFGNTWQPTPPTLNFGQLIPGMSGPGGQAMGMLVQPFLQQFAHSQGLAALQFMGTQNLYDTFQAHHHMTQRNLAMAQAQQADHAQGMRMFQGMARLTGTPWNDDRQASAQNLLNVFGQMSPFLSMAMPETYDQLYGTRGSALIMSQGIFRGGMSALDPVTGNIGLTGDSAGHITRRLYDRIYERGGGIAETRGLSAGQMGMLYEEMQSRGFMGGGGEALARRAADRVGGPVGPDDLREEEMRRIADRLKPLAGAVSAMRDIFGDAGKPDAPMRQLISGLQALTQGGLATMDPGQLEQILRKTQMLARTTGLGLQGMMQLNASAAGVTDQLGLDRSFAPLIANSAAAYSQAFAQEKGMTGGYGMLDRSGAMMMDMQLTAGAARSPMAAQLGGILMLSDRQRGQAGYKGSALEAMAQAIDRGDTSFEYQGRKRDLAMSPRDLQELLRGQVSDRDFFSVMSSPESAQFYAGRTMGVTRRMQSDQVRSTMRVGMIQELQAAGIANPEAVADRALTAFFSVDPNQLSDPVGRISAIMKAMGEDPDASPNLAGALGNAMLGVDRNLSAYGVRSTGALAQLYSPRMEQGRRRVDMAMAARGELAGMLSTLGRGGLTRNLMDFIAGAPDGQPINIADFITQAVAGGVSQEDLTKALTNNPHLDTLQGLFQQLSNEKDPAMRESIAKAIQQVIGQDIAPLMEGVRNVSGGRPPAVALPFSGAPAWMGAAVDQAANFGRGLRLPFDTGGVGWLNAAGEMAAASEIKPEAATPVVRLDPGSELHIVGDLNLRNGQIEARTRNSVSS